MGAARTLLLVQPLLLGIAMCVESLLTMTITKFYHVSAILVLS